MIKTAWTRALLVGAIVSLLPVLTSSASQPESTEPGRVCVIHETSEIAEGEDSVSHGGGLNSCGCHFNRKTGVCHCHRAPACGC